MRYIIQLSREEVSDLLPLISAARALWQSVHSPNLPSDITPMLPWYLDYLDIYLILSRYHPDLNLISAAQALWQSVHSPNLPWSQPRSPRYYLDITVILSRYQPDIIPILSWISAAQAHQHPMILTDSYVISPDIIQYPIRYYPILSSTLKPHKTYHPYQVTIWSCRPRNWCKLNSFWS